MPSTCARILPSLQVQTPFIVHHYVFWSFHYTLGDFLSLRLAPGLITLFLNPPRPYRCNQTVYLPSGRPHPIFVSLCPTLFRSRILRHHIVAHTLIHSVGLYWMLLFSHNGFCSLIGRTLNASWDTALQWVASRWALELSAPT